MYYPYLGKLCALVIPCALIAVDHWSPQVKVRNHIANFVGLIHFSHCIAFPRVNSWHYLHVVTFVHFVLLLHDKLNDI